MDVSGAAPGRRLAFIQWGLLALLLSGLAACSWTGGWLAPAEPDDYRAADYRAAVPLTLRGAEVLDTGQVAWRLADRLTRVIDVLPREPKPPRLAPGSLWLPAPHEGISGAVWLPNVGYGDPPPAVQAYFRESLSRLTGGDLDRALVFYCRSDCWMSWNAAKRAVSLGYRRVFWYRDGIEAWRAAGYPLAILAPYSPDTR